MSNLEKQRTKSSPGRPRSFDTETVVRRAVALFCEKGFEATSLDDVQKHLGIRRSTVYNSFGGKTGLYRAAVDAYLSVAQEQLFAPIHEGEAGLEDLVQLLERQRTLLTDPAIPAGCIVINAMVTGGDKETVKRYTRLLRSATDVALARASKLGEIKSSDSAMLSAAFLSMIVGVSISARSNMDVAEIHRSINGLVYTVRAWNLHAQAPRTSRNISPAQTKSG